MARPRTIQGRAISSRERGRFNVGLFIPISGAAGIWGPSCRSCAELAVAEINARGGLQDREIVLEIVDAGRSGADVADVAQAMLADGKMDALVGMHTSDVREAIAQRIAGRAPYVYTPLYEGGEIGRGVYCIGETPARQLLPGLEWLIERFNARRWALIGNDYIWPRTTHRIVRRHFRHHGGEILDEIYVPFGTSRFAQIVDRVKALNPDAVLLSVVGEDSVHFNRAFAAAGLSSSIIRFSCAIEENMLLAIGESNLERLFVVSGYFGALNTRGNASFRERYYARYGERGPTLNTIGQSLYEGMRFLDALSRGAEAGDWRWRTSVNDADSVRGGLYDLAGESRAPIYLAEARGYDFRILASFPQS
jgi:ABC-type branched-subunit amino acid transport system substrate-binding protein